MVSTRHGNRRSHTACRTLSKSALIIVQQRADCHVRKEAVSASVLFEACTSDHTNPPTTSPEMTQSQWIGIPEPYLYVDRDEACSRDCSQRLYMFQQ